jgi:PKHD-type hydroxylase
VNATASSIESSELNLSASLSHGWLSKEECATALSLARAFSEVNDQLSYGALGSRNSRTALVERGTRSNWLFDRIWAHAARVNQRYRFDIEGIETPLQIVRYRAHEHVDWHVDCGGLVTEGGGRKISISVQLSAPESYEGGDFEFVASPLHPFARLQGTLLAFPSFTSHRVTSVTSGVRYALVAFAVGAPFR